MSEARERVILGTILLDDRRWGEISSLNADDFQLSSHRRIFSEIRAMKDRGLSVDYVALAEYMGHARVKEVGGMLYLSSELVDGLPRLPNLSQYVDGLKEDARKRRAKLAGTEYLNKLERGQDVGEANRALLESLETQGESKASCLDILCIDDVKPLPINWLWKPYLAKGMLHILNGNAFAGKTFIALALSAGVTLGRMPFTEERFEPANVLYLQSENAIAQTMRPRFDLTGGNHKRFHLVTGTVWSDEQKQHRGCVSLGELDKLEEAFQKYRPGLLVVDPFTGYIGAGVDMYRANEIRPIMEGLGRLAEQYQVCVLLMRHFSKGSVGMNSMHRGMGSVDFTNVARSELFAAILPDEDGVVPRGGPGPRALVHGASNIGPVGDSLEYRIGDDGVFGWVGKLDLDLEQLMNPGTMQDGAHGALKAATEWLKAYLTPNSQSAKEVEAAAKQNSISHATLQRAKFVLQVKARKTSLNGGWVWWLPGCGTEKEDGSGPLPVQ